MGVVMETAIKLQRSLLL